MSNFGFGAGNDEDAAIVAQSAHEMMDILLGGATQDGEAATKAMENIQLRLFMVQIKSLPTEQLTEMATLLALELDERGP